MPIFEDGFDVPNTDGGITQGRMRFNQPMRLSLKRDGDFDFPKSGRILTVRSRVRPATEFEGRFPVSEEVWRSSRVQKVVKLRTACRHGPPQKGKQ